MIDPAHVVTMARYNAWQNAQLTTIFEGMTLEELTTDRGAFFGSILNTASHLLWGDQMWMSRFDPSIERPEGGIAASISMCKTAADWAGARFRLDGRIRKWAGRLHALDLTGEMTFFSGALGRETSCQRWLAVAHMFNHQTHHRGQIHAMLTAAGKAGPVTDLFIMPAEI